MPTHHDAVILGAGPAGSMAALVLARAGFDILLIDKAEFPRPKVCGDCIHPRAWEIWERQGLQEGFAALEHFAIRHVQLSADFSDPVTLEMDPGQREERVVARETLDAWLLEEARRAGARVRTRCIPYQLLPNNTLVTSHGIHQGRILIGADGRNSWLAHQAGLSRPRSRCPRIAWQATLPADRAVAAVHMSFFPEGYFGLAPFNPHQANLCMVLKQEAGAVPQAIAERYFPGCGPLTWRSSAPITRPAHRPAAGRVLLAGDAARVVEPYTGEGIALALASGELAADCAVRALRQGDPEAAAADYTARHHALYRKVSWQNSLTRWLGCHPQWGRRASRLLARHPALARRAVAPVFH